MNPSHHLLWEREEHRGQEDVTEYKTYSSVWKQINSTCSSFFFLNVVVKDGARLRHISSHALIVLLWGHGDATCLRVCSNLVCFLSCAAQVSNIISWCCILSFGAHASRADCKLIPSVGMSILLTFKPQGAPDTLAARIESMHHESAETDI